MLRAMEQEQDMTIEEVAKRLHVSYRTAYKRVVEQRLIRARREGSKWRVSKSDLQAYIDSTYRNALSNEGMADDV